MCRLKRVGLKTISRAKFNGLIFYYGLTWTMETSCFYGVGLIHYAIITIIGIIQNCNCTRAGEKMNLLGLDNRTWDVKFGRRSGRHLTVLKTVQAKAALDAPSWMRPWCKHTIVGYGRT